MTEKTKTFTLVHADCSEYLKTLPDNSIDACVCDPPAGINFMSKSWDSDKGGRDKWIAWMAEIAREVNRVLKPGAHALVWALPRTSHWTATAWEDGGFEIREIIHHIFGSGFPKSLDVSKAIDKKLEREREVVATQKLTGKSRVMKGGNYTGDYEGKEITETVPITAPASDEAKQWSGWGTALKPAVEQYQLFQSKYSTVPFLYDMMQVLHLLEGILWLFAPVKFAEHLLTLRKIDCIADQCGSVRWIVAVAHGLLLSEAELMKDTSISPEMVSTFLSIVSSWNSILDVLWKRGSMFTTETASEMTIALRTLKFSISQIMPASMLLDGTLASGLSLDVSNAAGILSAANSGQNQYLGIFAAESATALRDIKRLFAAVAANLSSPVLAQNGNTVHPAAPTGQPDKMPNDVLNTLAQIVALSSKQNWLASQNSADEPAWQPLLKSSPAVENYILCRKPFKGSVAANVMQHGTGALNIDGCRVKAADDPKGWSSPRGGIWATDSEATAELVDNEAGRWPANVITDGSEEVLAGFPNSKSATGSCSITRNPGNYESKGGYYTEGRVNEFEGYGDEGSAARFFHNTSEGRWPANLVHDGSEEVLAEFPNSKSSNTIGKMASSGYQQSGDQGAWRDPDGAYNTVIEEGSAARYFYCAKASVREREIGLANEEPKAGVRTNAPHQDEDEKTKSRLNSHPTCKPKALMAYLIRLITPPNGTVIDPFMGSGSTGLACHDENKNFIGIEREKEYVDIAEKRIRGYVPEICGHVVRIKYEEKK